MPLAVQGSAADRTKTEVSRQDHPVGAGQDFVSHAAPLISQATSGDLGPLAISELWAGAAKVASTTEPLRQLRAMG